MDARSNTSQTTQSMKQMMTEVNDFLAKLHIKSVHESDIFEHTLLKLAEISTYGSCHFSYNDDKNIQIDIGDLSKVNAAQFLDFFNKASPGCARITDSYYEEDHKEDAGKPEYNKKYDYYFIRKPIVNFKIDGTAFFRDIYPSFKATLETLKSDESAWLKPYLQVPKLGKVKSKEFVASTLPMFSPKQNKRNQNENSEDEDSDEEETLLFGPGIRH